MRAGKRSFLLLPNGLALVLLGAVAAARPAAASAAGGQLAITVVDRDTGKPIACRMHLRNAAGKPQKPEKVPFWHDHFVLPGEITLKLPKGNYTFQLERGPEYLVRDGYFTIDDFADDRKQVDLGRLIDMAAKGWWSGDLFVRRGLRDIEPAMAADDLHVAQVITCWNDKQEPAGQPLPKTPLVCFDRNRCYHALSAGYSRAGTELLLLNLPASWKPLAARGDYLPSMNALRAAREDNDSWLDLSRPFSWDLPLLVAAGQINSIEVAHSHMGREGVVAHEADGRPRDKQRWPGPLGNAQWSQHIYFQLLECGLHIPPTAGSGSGVAPNPVGYNRVYVHVDGEFSYPKWWQGLRAGRVCVTNGPLMQPSVRGQRPGHVFHAEAGESEEFEIGLTLSSRDPITYLEIIQNAEVAHSVRIEEYAKIGKLPKVRFDRSGWFLVRAVTDVPKTYRFAMTGPYYVEIGQQRRISKRAAQFFLDWTYQRARQLKQTDSAEARALLEEYRAACDYWQDLLSKATAE